MPTEQQNGTAFTSGDQIDLQRAHKRLLKFDAVHAAPRELSPEQAALEREKIKTAEFLKTMHGQIGLVAKRAVELRRQAAAGSIQEPLDSRRDFGAKQDYELIG